MHTPAKQRLPHFDSATEAQLYWVEQQAHWWRTRGEPAIWAATSAILLFLAIWHLSTWLGGAA